MFVDMVDEIFMQLEDELDEIGEGADEEIDEDIDIDTSGGLLTVTFSNASTIVLSKQIGQHEIWVAAVSGGYHLAFHKDGFHKGKWYCRTTEESLPSLLSRVFSEQLGRPVTLLQT